jgi:hypothetical protein
MHSYSRTMPLTYFAHQVPVLPIARRWPRFDGLALVIGSMAPDFAYVLNGSRLALWAHGMPGMVLFCVPVTLAICWITSRVLSPVVWDHLPNLEPFYLRDYRGLAAHRYVWPWAALGALIGAASHVALDHFTHDWGWFAQHVDWYDSVVIEGVFSRNWTVFRLVQYAGHVVGTAVGVWMLARYGRARWMATRRALVPPFEVSRRSTLTLVIAFVAGLSAGLAWVLSNRVGIASETMRVSATTFAALTLACVGLLRPWRSPSSVGLLQASGGGSGTANDELSM